MVSKRNRVEVGVEQGRLAGRWKSKRSVAVFRGVPFAAPPVGDLRWRPPARPDTWDGVREADKDGPMAIQRAADLERFMHELLTGQGWSTARTRAIETMLLRLPQPPQSEDCLYLTVRTPSPEPGAKLPVMVWIHGGDHQDGSGADIYYAANALAGHGVVTVSINYRLGVMGYLAHPELMDESAEGVAGNYGTLDQVAALEWVRDNIASFGGDPGNVTIFGESAGGESVLHLLTSPLARGLFHRAVAQSPANSGQMMRLTEPFGSHEAATELSLRFAAELGVTGDKQLRRLRAMSVGHLYQLARADRVLGNHYPVIDGHVLPESPFAAFAAGRQAPVPFIVGSNADEGTLIRPVMEATMIDFQHAPQTPGQLQPEIADAFGPDMDRLLELYPGLDRAELGAEIDFLGDHMFGARAYYYARHHAAAGHPTSLYFFARTPKGDKQTAGAYHAAELPFVHGSRVPVFPMTAADTALSTEMMRYWTEFARTGDPNGVIGGVDAERGLPAAGHPWWPMFDPADPRWIRFDHTITVGPVDRREQYEIFNARTDRLVAEMAALTAS
ncbi:MAG: carboxylesterase family protein [Actinomycetota bacterium]